MFDDFAQSRAKPAYGARRILLWNTYLAYIPSHSLSNMSLWIEY